MVCHLFGAYLEVVSFQSAASVSDSNGLHAMNAAFRQCKTASVQPHCLPKFLRTRATAVVRSDGPKFRLQVKMLSSQLYGQAGLAGLMRSSVSSPLTQSVLASPA